MAFQSAENEGNLISSLRNHMRFANRLLIPIALTLLTSGCMSIASRTDTHTSIEQRVYPGVLKDISLFDPDNFGGDMQGGQIIFYPMGIIDLPLSFVLDTIFLPVDLFQHGHNIHRVQNLCNQYLSNYRIIRNTNKAKSPFYLYGPFGDKVEFDRTVESFSKFIKSRNVKASRAREAEDIFRLLEMLVYGEVSLGHGWQYTVERQENSWKVSIKSGQTVSLITDASPCRIGLREGDIIDTISTIKETAP